MNRVAVAKELVRLARELMSMEFPTQDAMDKYLKEHPDADRSLHRVKKTEAQHPSGVHRKKLDEHRQREISRVLGKKPGESLSDDDIRRFHSEGGPNRKDVDWFGLGKGKTP